MHTSYPIQFELKVRSGKEMDVALEVIQKIKKEHPDARISVEVQV